MKTFSSLRNTVAVAILAGAGLSGCAGDPFFDNRADSNYNQPVYSQRYYDTNAQGNYYTPSSPTQPYYYTPNSQTQPYYYPSNSSTQPYYTDRPYYYQQR